MIIMVRKEKKCNLCTRIKVLPISPVRTMGGITNNISEICKVVSVSDGDTFSCRHGWTRTEIIRLIGVDTPETKHPNKPVEFFGKGGVFFLLKKKNYLWWGGGGGYY